MSNIVPLDVRRRRNPSEGADPAKRPTHEHLKALQDIELQCRKAIEAGGLGESRLVQEEFMIAVHRALLATDWNVRFYRRNGQSG